MTTLEMQQTALYRAENCRGAANLMTVFVEFQQRGIHIDDIHPGVNVLTFHAWKAKGRTVCKGEKGVQLLTWIPYTDKDGEESIRPKTTYVFHESQTKEIKGK
jgi:hypothetical protein